MKDPRLGLQLYTMRSLDAALPDLLRSVAEAGYQGVESVGTQGEDPARLRDALSEAGLELASAHVPLADLRADLAAVVATHRALSTPLLVVPWLAPEQRPADLGGWAVLGRQLDALGGLLGDEGMALAYHHHDFELVRHGDRDGLTALLEAAAPARLSLELDTGWLLAVGEDPQRWLASWGRRVTRLHLKDLNPAVSPPWVDVGDGALDLPAVVAAARAEGVPWLIVEHDTPADPPVTMRRSAEAVRRTLAGG